MVSPAADPLLESTTLRVSFHGRVIDHLGIQMYQSPVAALAEMISNAWDADAENVWISLPGGIGASDLITVRDDGTGMTRQACQEKYLKVGWCRRGSDIDAKTEGKLRPVLGRKGIGKFAGFGISRLMTISTTSVETGEHTEFDLNVDGLRGSEFIETTGGDIEARFSGPDEARRPEHGTTISLSQLTLGRSVSESQLSRGLARRFLLLKRAADFKVFVNGNEVTTTDSDPNVEFEFPGAYTTENKPAEVTVAADGWAEETLPNGSAIRWRYCFYKTPLDVEELRGVAVYANGKLAQMPFLFNLRGGLGGQVGLEYLSGQVEAAFIDLQRSDLIATERQRINWDSAEAAPLERWGQDRLRQLLRIWQELRGKRRQEKLEEKLARFSQRLGGLPSREEKVVRRALAKLGQVAALSESQFEELGAAILTAWEQGRLHDLVTEISNSASMDEAQLLQILVEADTLTALSAGESIRTKLLTIAELKKRIDNRSLENSIRDYLASHPWLIDPSLDTFKREITLRRLYEECRQGARMVGDDWDGRVDLVLEGGTMLVVMEFMRPGLTLDRDHVNRFENYVDAVRQAITPQTGSRFSAVTGYIVADRIGGDGTLPSKLERLRAAGMFAFDWPELLGRAVARWRDQLEILVRRTTPDPRLAALLEDGQAANSSRADATSPSTADGQAD